MSFDFAYVQEAALIWGQDLRLVFTSDIVGVGVVSGVVRALMT